MSRVYKRLKAKPAGTMSFMRKSDGTYTADVGELDAMLRSKWDSVFACKGESKSEHIAQFMSQYDSYLYKHEPVVLQPLTGQELRQAAIHSPHNAGGMDGWTPAEMSLLSEHALFVNWRRC